MSTIGNQTTGFTFTVSAGAGWGDLAGGSYTMPSPGGFITQLNAYAGNGGTTQSCRLYMWQDNGAGKPGTWLVRGTNTQSILGLGWQGQATLSANGAAGISSDLYIPGGTVIWLGVYLSAGSGQIQAASSSGGGTEIGLTSDGNWSDHGPATLGQMAAYAQYNALAAPTISSISPSVSPPGSNVTITGTNFLHATSVTFAGNSASFTANSDTQITATVPSNVGGVVTVTVTNPAGSASSSMTAGQIYYGTGTGVASIKNVYYGTGTGVAKVAGIWVPNGAGVKRVW